MIDAAFRMRAARPGDLDEIVRLCAAHAKYESAAYDPVGKTNALRGLLFGPQPRLHCVVTERGNSAKLAGYATWSLEVSTWYAGFYAHMDCLYLDPDARGRGLGRMLMGRVTAAALAHGAIELQWQTPTFNAGAIRFYERFEPAQKGKIRFHLDSENMRRLSAEADR